ncbi:hypothetical protein [Cupriavidus necator]|uniref:hypothetical protein n=1 Tax=Cupriavidus necator TaxID=106590 RepID=UPI00148FDB3A|nr:hypothetical protein [Cupriavidus necator]
MTKTKRTVCPSPAYREYRPDQATRLAAERAARVQPPLFTLASNVPAYTKDAK